MNKLLVPSTLGLFVYHWISGYLNVKWGGGLASIPLFLRYPVFVMAGTGPLWFIQMLFLFSVCLVLLRKIDKKDKVWMFCGQISTVKICLLVFLIWGAAQILNLPVLTTYRFGIYGTAYLLGYLIFSHDEVQNSIAKLHRPLLIVAIILGVAYTVRYFGVSYASDECLKSFSNQLLFMGRGARDPRLWKNLVGPDLYFCFIYDQIQLRVLCGPLFSGPVGLLPSLPLRPLAKGPELSGGIAN